MSKLGERVKTSPGNVGGAGDVVLFAMGLPTMLLPERNVGGWFGVLDWWQTMSLVLRGGGVVPYPMGIS